jgi:hypothetical protein
MFQFTPYPTDRYTTHTLHTNSKSEILNPKYETNSNVINPNVQNRLSYLEFCILILFRISIFDIRIFILRTQCELFLRTVNPDIIGAELPHSETAGSKVVGTSPTNIAAVCVLPKPKSPRHPLSAL